MRRFARSETYARARLVNAAIFIVLGTLVGVRAFAYAGFAFAGLPAYVLAAAMIGLGVYRLRMYLQARAERLGR